MAEGGGEIEGGEATLWRYVTSRYNSGIGVNAIKNLAELGSAW